MNCFFLCFAFWINKSSGPPLKCFDSHLLHPSVDCVTGIAARIVVVFTLFTIEPIFAERWTSMKCCTLYNYASKTSLLKSQQTALEHPRIWSDMKPHLHLQEKVPRRNCFSCVQPFCSSCKKAAHLHTKDIAPSHRRKMGSALWLQLAFEMQTTCLLCKWYSEKLAQRQIKGFIGRMKFKLQIFLNREDFFRVRKMVKISIFPLGMELERNVEEIWHLMQSYLSHQN